jgi:hypothetical protein
MVSNELSVVPYSEQSVQIENKKITDSVKINPQELGQVIVGLQEEIQNIKHKLENLPGYDIGKLQNQKFSNSFR